MSQRTLMCRAQDHAWHLVDFECFLPTRGTQAPTITWFEPSEAELWHGSRKIIAARFGKREKLRCHHSADSVAPYVLTPRIAATIAIEPCHGFERTHFKRLTEYVAGWNRSSAPVILQLLYMHEKSIALLARIAARNARQPRTSCAWLSVSFGQDAQERREISD